MTNDSDFEAVAGRLRSRLARDAGEDREAVVRAFAASRPLSKAIVTYSEGGPVFGGRAVKECRFCGRIEPGQIDHHRADCVWRQAREWADANPEGDE